MKNVVGLTGFIGSGKSLVAEYFHKHLGIAIVDTDKIAHQITSTDGIAMNKIRQQFGKKYITPNGALDRKAMRNLVFNDANARTLLEKILHPLIFDASCQQIELSKSVYTIVVVPLLFRSLKYMSIVRRSIFVNCDRSILITRVMARNKLNAAEVKAILSAQVPLREQISLSDDILNNSGNISNLYSKIRELDLKYRGMIT